MPPGTDPCQPAGSGGLQSSTRPDPEWDGTCGPQPPNNLPDGLGVADAQYTPVNSSELAAGDMSSPPGSSPEPSPPLPACMWSWLSCHDWHIVAVNLSYCGYTADGGADTDAAIAGGANASDPTAAAAAAAGTRRCGGAPLRGFLPASAPQLSALASLDLSGNPLLLGGLPLGAWATPWASLKVLNMSGCGLAGTLPPDWSALPALEVLDLSRNALLGTLPPGMGSLSALRELRLAFDTGLLGNLPPAWAALGRLQLLDVRGVCRLCGSSSLLPALTAALTTGSHLDAACRLEECGAGGRSMQGVFQGVMAGFACVLGLAAAVLLARRLQSCIAARWLRGRAQHRRRGAHQARSSGGGSGAALDSAYGSSDGGGDRWSDAGPSAYQSRRRRHYSGPAVPLYVVEFGLDGRAAEWSVDLVLGKRRHRPAPAAAQAQAAAESRAPGQQQASPLQDGRRLGREWAEVELAAGPPLRAASQDGEEGVGSRGGDGSGGGGGGSQPDGASSGGIAATAAAAAGVETARVPALLVLPPALRGGSLGRPPDEREGRSAPADDARAVARPGTPRPVDPVLELAAAAAAAASTLPQQPTSVGARVPGEGFPAPVPPDDGARSSGHVGASGDGSRGGSGGGGVSSGDGRSGSGAAASDARPLSGAAAAAAAGGEAGELGPDTGAAATGAVASATTARRGERLWRAALKLARPPQAVILMPNGWEVCLGRRVAAPAARAGTQDVAACPSSNGSGGRCDGRCPCPCCCSDDEAHDVAAAGGGGAAAGGGGAAAGAAAGAETFGAPPRMTGQVDVALTT